MHFVLLRPSKSKQIDCWRCGKLVRERGWTIFVLRRSGRWYGLDFVRLRDMNGFDTNLLSLQSSDCLISSVSGIGAGVIIGCEGSAATRLSRKVLRMIVTARIFNLVKIGTTLEY